MMYWPAFARTSRRLCIGTGRRIPWQAWDGYNLAEIFDIEHQACIEAFLSHDVLSRCEPEPFARELLQAASETGMSVHILTARGWHPDGRAITEHWLREHAIPVDHLEVIELGRCKSGYLAGLPVRPSVFVDDAPHHIQGAIPHVERALLMDRPWNRTYAHTDRIGSLVQASAILHELP